MFWALWGDLPLPNVLVPFDEARLAEIQHALSAHAGELARNPLNRLLEARAVAQAILGQERLFGFGVPGGRYTYVELLTHARFTSGQGWRWTEPRVFDVNSAAEPSADHDLGWWLRAPSPRDSLRSA
jgi:hypothetical protein